MRKLFGVCVLVLLLIGCSSNVETVNKSSGVVVSVEKTQYTLDGLRNVSDLPVVVTVIEEDGTERQAYITYEGIEVPEYESDTYGRIKLPQEWRN